MHKNKSIATCLILILALSFAALLLQTPKVKADGYDYNWGEACNLYATDWCQWNSTVEYISSLAFQEIYYIFSTRYNFLYEYYTGPLVDQWPVYGHLQNWGGGSTTESLTLNQIDDSNSYHWFSTDLYVGHGTGDYYFGHSTNPNDPDDYNSIDWIYYSNIRDHADDQPYQQFVVNWVCWGANDIDYQQPYYTWGAPYDWNPLYWNGQSGSASYCWIGFNYASPWLSDNMLTRGAYPGTSGDPNIYKTWLVFFYYYALSGNNFDNNYMTVWQALNQASYDTGYYNYQSSILDDGFTTYWPYNGGTYGDGNMVVVGDTGLYLPANLVMFMW
jgi:hypothetical protein